MFSFRSDVRGSVIVEFALILSLLAICVYAGFRYTAASAAAKYRNVSSAQLRAATVDMPSVGIPNSMQTP